MHYLGVWRRIRPSGHRPQRRQNSARLSAASIRSAIKSAALWETSGGSPSQSANPAPSWAARYRRIGPTSALRQLAASRNSRRLARYAKTSSRMILDQSPRAMRQRPHWRQLFSRNSTASRRSATRGPAPLSGIWVRNSVNTAPNPSLRQAFDPASTGNTRSNASNTITIDPGVMCSPHFVFGGGIIALGLKRVQPCSCKSATAKFPRLWSVFAGLDSNFAHAAFPPSAEARA